MRCRSRARSAAVIRQAAKDSMPNTRQLVRINAPQLATATDRVLYASTSRSSRRAAHDIIARQQALATASRRRSWLLVAMIVVSAIVAAAIVGHTGHDVVVHDASVA
jgi:hypothetical protein